MGPTEIGRRLRIGESTVRRFLNKFIQVGCSFERLGHKERGKFKMFPETVRRQLLDDGVLEAWMPFSLKERIQLIERLFHITTSPKTLGQFYREHHVQYKTTKQCYRRAIDDREELEEERLQYSVLLGNVLTQGRAVIYIDQSSFHNQAITPRSWAGPNKNQQYPIQTLRYSTIVFGAIGTCLKKPFYRCYPTTD